MKKEYTQDSWWYSGEPERMREKMRWLWHTVVLADVLIIGVIIALAFGYYDQSEEAPAVSNAPAKNSLNKLFDRTQLQAVVGALVQRTERYQMLTKTFVESGDIEN